MNYLLDTHIALWYFDHIKKLSPNVIEILQEKNKLYISIASLWETTIKSSQGKLDLNCNIDDFINKINNNFKIVHISDTHLLELSKLPFHHKDPFDRLIISQAIAENFTLISSDRKFDYYDIKLVK